MNDDLMTDFQKMLARQAAMLNALANKRNSYGKNGGSVARQKRQSRKRRNKQR
jgi:hypothetical protein